MRRISFEEGEYYHLYNRGVDKRTIFESPQEYKRFLGCLFVLNGENNLRPANLSRSRSILDISSAQGRGGPLIAIGAFCLMPNHFHLLVTPLVEGGISKFMQRLQTAYTMYFNEKHERSGALFQGTFKAQYAGRDSYLKYLFSYIHLNPAKLADPEWKSRGPKNLNKLRAHIKSYPYSSIGEYLSGRHFITNPRAFPHYFENIKEVEEHINFWLKYRNAEQDT